MSYTLYNTNKTSYIAPGPKYRYTDKIEDAIRFRSEELALHAITHHPEYDIASRIIIACNSENLTVVEIDLK